MPRAPSSPNATQLFSFQPINRPCSIFEPADQLSRYFFPSLSTPNNPSDSFSLPFSTFIFVSSFLLSFLSLFFWKKENLSFKRYVRAPVGFAKDFLHVFLFLVRFEGIWLLIQMIEFMIFLLDIFSYALKRDIDEQWGAKLSLMDYKIIIRFKILRSCL